MMIALLISPVIAQERKSFAPSQQLYASCKSFNVSPEHVDSLPCVFYIKGVIAGAWGVDNVKPTKLVIKKRKPATWEDRAYSFRVGKRGDRAQSKSIISNCSSHNETESRIIDQLIKDSISPFNTVQALNNQIYNAMKAICLSD